MKLDRSPENVAKAVHRAAAELPRLPEFRRQVRVDHGMPVASSSAYGGKVSREEADEAPIENVKIAGLRAVQRGVNLETLIAHVERDEPGGKVTKGGSNPARDPGDLYPRDCPIVVRCGGERYVHDGHHRVVAARLLGADTVEARVVTIEKHPLKRWADEEE